MVLIHGEAAPACGDNAGAHAFSPDSRAPPLHTVTPTVANFISKVIRVHSQR